MKQFLKKYAMTLVALVIASGTLMSFELAERSALADEVWFEFTDELGDGNINNPANYMLTIGGGVNPPACPNGTDERCAVQAQPIIGDEDHPNLSTVVDTKVRKQL